MVINMNICLDISLDKRTLAYKNTDLKYTALWFSNTWEGEPLNYELAPVTTWCAHNLSNWTLFCGWIRLEQHSAQQTWTKNNSVNMVFIVSSEYCHCLLVSAPQYIITFSTQQFCIITHRSVYPWYPSMEKVQTPADPTPAATSNSISSIFFFQFKMLIVVMVDGQDITAKGWPTSRFFWPVVTWLWPVKSERYLLENETR